MSAGTMSAGAVAEVAGHVPDALAAYRGGVAEGPGGPAAMPLAALRDPAVFEATLAAFAGGLGVEQGAWQGAERGTGAADRCALVSYWSQFYLAALATPALTALVRLGRPLPLAFERTSLELDAAGRPARLLVEPGAPACAPGLAGLIAEHLQPFVALCHARCGLAPRVLWGNAAVILDYVARTLDVASGADPAAGPSPACAEIGACLGWCAGPACAKAVPAGTVPGGPLARALSEGPAGTAPACRRRTCCLRHRLPGVPSCGALCPLACTERCPGSRC